MSVRNPLFYTGTFVSETAAGTTPANMATLVDAMQNSCYRSFEPDRCSILSQMVGRTRAQEACRHQRPASSYTSSAELAAANLAASATRQPSISELTAALAALGGSSQTGLAALC